MNRSRRRLAFGQFFFSAACALAASLMVTAPLLAASYSWNVGTGDWATAGNWTPAGGPPTSSDSAFLTDGGTAQITAADGTVAAKAVDLGLVTNGVGTVQQTGGTANFNDVLLGGSAMTTGIYTISGTSVLNATTGMAEIDVGAVSGNGQFTQNDTSMVTANVVTVGTLGGFGLYTLNSGDLTANNSMTFGSGTGGLAKVNQYGGSITSPGLTYMAYSSGAGATVQQSGGVDSYGVNNMSPSDLIIGDLDNGTSGYYYESGGGTMNVGANLDLGFSTGAKGLYQISGNSTATIGGTVYVGGNSTGMNMGTGSFQMDALAKSFTAAGMVVNNGSTALFTGPGGGGGPTLNIDTVVINQGGTMIGSAYIKPNQAANVSFTNNGNLYPGQTGIAGVLSILGNFTQTSTGTDYFQLGGTSNYDQLQVFGSAMLDGMLSVSYIGNFDPANGDKFNLLITDNGVNGTFANVSLPPLDPGLTWQLTYKPTSVQLAVVPEPATWLLAVVALPFIGVFARATVTRRSSAG
jgi:hypothetical protein